MTHRITAFTIDTNDCKVFKECRTINGSYKETLHNFMNKHNHSFKTCYDVIAIHSNGEIAYIDTYKPNNTTSLTVESYNVTHYNPKRKTARITDDEYRIEMS